MTIENPIQYNQKEQIKRSQRMKVWALVYPLNRQLQNGFLALLKNKRKDL